MRIARFAGIVFCSVIAAWIGLAAGPAFAATAYTYDDLGRLATVTYDNGKTIIYSYDPAGNRTQVVTQTGAANQAPTAVNDSTSTAMNTAVTLDPRSNDSDPDSDTLTIITKSDGAHGTVTINGGGVSVTYTPTTGYIGSDSFTYTISDGNSHSASATVSVTVTSTNHAPVAVADSTTTTRNVAKTLDPRTNDTDADGDTLTISAKTDGTHGTVVINSGTSVTYTPATGYTGADSFTYTISDGHGGSATGTVSVTVNTGSNTAPVAVNDSVLITKNHVLGVPVTPTKTFDPRFNDSDADGDSIAITAKTNGTLGTVYFSSTSLTYTYNSSVTGTLDTTDSFTYTISDGFGGTSTATVSVHIVVNTLD